MKHVVIRDVEAGDIPGIKNVMREVWDWASIIGEEAAIDSALGLYLNQFLYNGTFGRAAILDGKMAGVIFGSVNEAVPKYRMLQEDGTAHAFSLLGSCERDRENIYEYFSKLKDVDEKLVRGIGDEYDGTLGFLALAKESQGLGVGKKLWLALKEYFLENNANAIYLYSDTECNFGFYERQGFKRRRELEVVFAFDGEPYATKQFLYEFRFEK